MIQPERIQPQNDADLRAGRYVLYWMQASQRVSYNHALEYAIELANHLNVPLVAGFGLTASYPAANLRHYYFMLEGLVETSISLAKRGVQLVVRYGEPDSVAAELAQDARCVVVDRGYTRVQRAWRARAAAQMTCRLVQVESDAIVPVEAASGKQEYAAAALRPKIARLLKRYLMPLPAHRVKKDSLGLRIGSVELGDIDTVTAPLAIDRSVAPSPNLRGGTMQAKKLLTQFVAKKLTRYADDRNDPYHDAASHLSPYLHFGQVSPLEIALKVMRRKGKGAAAFLEQLIVRRELAINYVFYNPHYDALEGLPAWARATLATHNNDRRAYTYARDELERAATHDPYWNAAQKEMVATGTMHGYMRMYWGKKLLEWVADPAEAYAIACYLNDRYELDGRDPNGYTGVAWCFGAHDRPWASRPIFGNVRYMNDKGLERKFDIASYVRHIEELTR